MSNGLGVLHDIANIEAYLKVIEMKSFSKAAKALGCSQPSISARVKQIETTLGKRVLQRRKRGLIMTEEGEKLHVIMRRYQSAVGQAQIDLEKIKAKQFSFIIGATDIIYDFILPKYIQRIHKDAATQIYLKNSTNEVLIEALKNDDIDLALLESKVSAVDWDSHEWFKDEIVFFSSRPLAAEIVPQVLYDSSLLFHNKRSLVQQKIDRLFKRHAIDPSSFDVVGVNDHLSSVKEAILRSSRDLSSRQMLSWIPKKAIENELIEERLYAASMGEERIEHTFYIAYKKSRSSESAIMRIMSSLMAA